ncbi:MAG: 50S ribosomal protein L14 [Candidatus Roizmanbacteria bacterium GW2011_GWA2_34_18]|uniref:Large ribosomal subunit protein uL14 n=1 Tax=Candidatus Roizmanbacteria bacterium GW2011_GWA2_34_18 TaxID=1618477 RepID=A0A0G0E011_9BACT|nr:MAG: 50S ribosomal protein L14 [Candidatus Roizmanbacteria bacterium GW2011_GWA2_34_18]
MLQLRTILNVADNTGAKKVSMIGMAKKGNRKFAYLGEVINITVKEALPFSLVKQGEVLSAVIVRTRKEKRRKDGSYIRFDENACVILASKEVKDPKGTRIFGPIGKEVKENGFAKIASLAEEIY